MYEAFCITLHKKPTKILQYVSGVVHLIELYVHPGTEHGLKPTYHYRIGSSRAHVLARARHEWLATYVSNGVGKIWYGSGHGRGLHSLCRVFIKSMQFDFVRYHARSLLLWWMIGVWHYYTYKKYHTLYLSS